MRTTATNINGQEYTLLTHTHTRRCDLSVSTYARIRIIERRKHWWTIAVFVLITAWIKVIFGWEKCSLLIWCDHFVDRRLANACVNWIQTTATANNQEIKIAFYGFCKNLSAQKKKVRTRCIGTSIDCLALCWAKQRNSLNKYHVQSFATYIHSPFICWWNVIVIDARYCDWLSRWFSTRRFNRIQSIHHWINNARYYGISHLDSETRCSIKWSFVPSNVPEIVCSCAYFRRS